MRSITSFFAALLGLFVFYGFAQAQNAWPVLTSMTHIPETIGVGMTSQLQLSFANAQVAGTANGALAVGSIQLRICGSPSYYKTDGATPPGGYGTNFAWTHSSNDCWVGVNEVAIAAGTGGTITLSYTGTQITPDPQETTANVTELTPACCSNTSAPTGLSASFAVVSPILSSGFSPTTIASRGTTTLTFTLSAANLAPANAVSFVDNLPAGLVVAPIPNIGGTCSNAAAATTAVAGGSTIAVRNVAVPSGPASCTITVDVTNAAGQTNASCAANPPAFTNGPGNIVNLSAAAANGVENSCLVVAAATTPNLVLHESASPTSISAAGQSVAYSFAVTNTGNVTLSNLAVTQTAFSGTGTVPVASCPATNLVPAATVICTASYTVTQADVDAGSISNTAMAAATTPTLNTVNSAPSSALVTATPTPALALIKTGTVSAASGSTPSGVITYRFSVINTGNVAFNRVSGVSDTLLPSLSCSLSSPPLAVGATQTLSCTDNVYTLTGADFKAGSVAGTAIASAVPAVCVPATTPCPAVSSAATTAISALPSVVPPSPAPALSMPAWMALLGLLAAFGGRRLGRSRS